MFSSRRRFLRTIGKISSATAMGLALPLRAAAYSQQITVNRDKSLVGPDGDCTSLIQSAIDKLPPQGGEVVVGPGEYLIDAVKSVRLRNGVSLTLEPGATLRAIPTDAGSYSVVRIYGATGARVHGGNIVGERNQHLGTKGEWGMGIDIRGSHDVIIQNVIVSECWGDGVYVGSLGDKDSGACSAITLRGVVARGNRRQGASIVSCRGALVEQCTFVDTKGTAPAAGIDLEPDAGLTVQDVQIVDCTTNNNQGDGIHLLAVAPGARVLNCTVTGGKSCGNNRYGISLVGSTGCRIEGTELTDNAGYAVFVRSTSADCVISPGKIARNMGRAAAFKTMLGIATNDIMVEPGAAAIRVDLSKAHG